MADVSGDETQQSVEKFAAQEIESRALAVNIARPREEHAPRAEGGGYRGGGYGRE